MKNDIITEEVIKSIKNSIHGSKYNIRFPKPEEFAEMDGFAGLTRKEQLIKFLKLGSKNTPDKFKVPNEQYIEGYKEKK